MSSYPPTAYYTDTGQVEPYHSYAHGMFWIVDDLGAFDSRLVAPPDHIVAVGPAGRPLAVDEVEFVVWSPPYSVDLDELTLISPFPSHGVPLSGNRRFTLEVLYLDAWLDITADVMSIDADTGTSSFGEHKTSAVALIELQSDEHKYAPWTPEGDHMRKGTPIRGVIHWDTDVDWLPVFTGEIDDNVEYSTTLDEEVTAMLTVVDTVSARLAQVQLADYRFGAVTQLATAVNILLDEADWPYGRAVEAPSPPGRSEVPQIGSNTVLFGTVAETLRRFADAYGMHVRADRYGRAWFTRRLPDLCDFAGIHPKLGAAPIGFDSNDADTEPMTITFAKDDVINDFAIVDYDFGGITGPATSGAGAAAVRRSQSQFDLGMRLDTGLGRGASNAQDTDDNPVLRTESASDAASIARYGRKQVKYTSPFPIGFVRYLYPTLVANVIDIRADDVWKIRNIRFDDRRLDLIEDLDVGRAVTFAHNPVSRDTAVTFVGTVARMRFRITPLNPSELNLTVDVDIDAFERSESAP